MWGLDEFEDDIVIDNENICSKCRFGIPSNNVEIYMNTNTLCIHYIKHPLHFKYKDFNGNRTDIVNFYNNINDESRYCEECLNDYITNDMIFDKLIIGESKCVCCNKFKSIQSKNWKRSFHKSLETFQFYRKQILISNQNDSINLDNYRKYRILNLFSNILRTTKRYYNERAQSFIDDINNNTNGNLWCCSDCYYQMIIEKKAKRNYNKFKHLPFFDYHIANDSKQIMSLKKLCVNVLDCKTVIDVIQHFSINIDNIF